MAGLISARLNKATTTDIPRLYVVAPLDDALPAVEEEVHRIQQFGDFDNLLEAAVTPVSIISNLQQNPWVHLACYGHRNEASFHSSFQLHANERLELIDLMKAQLPNAELAFL